MIFRLLAAALLLAGCSSPQQVNDPRTITETAPALETYVQKFESVYGHPVKVPVGFVDQTFPVVGMCVIWDTGDREIQIDPNQWTTFDDDRKTSLIFHELGHCILNRIHVSLMEYSPPHSYLIPVSLMYPSVFFDKSYADAGLWPYYINELMGTTGGLTSGNNAELKENINGCVTLKKHIK